MRPTGFSELNPVDILLNFHSIAGFLIIFKLSIVLRHYLLQLLPVSMSSGAPGETSLFSRMFISPWLLEL